MSARPSVSPGVLGGLAALVPARLRRRLEEAPQLAEAWTWTVSADSVEVVASPDARVTIAASQGTVATLDQVRCTCLLAPRCLHVAAVLLRLPLAEAEADQPEISATESPIGAIALGDDERAAAAQAWTAAAALLDAGAAGAGLLLTSELLRAVHSCREAGLHRAASAGLRVAQRLRDLHAQRPEFRLGALAGDLADLLSTARELATATDVPPDALGTARRAYATIGSLRVTGLFTEAIASAAGYAGVVTYVCDQSGRIWSLGDVLPGPPDRCELAYSAPVDLGDASRDHRTLGREGLHLQRATASSEGRLGSGRAVSAVRANGSAWTEEPLVRLWRDPLEAQLDRAWSARSGGASPGRRAGSDLVFVRGMVRGVRDNTLELLVDGHLAVSGVAPSDHVALAYRANLRLLGCAPGLPLLVVGRVLFGRPRAVLLLAVAPGEPDSQSPALDLPAIMANRVNLGLDVLQHANVRGAAASPALLPSASSLDGPPDPLAPVQRRLYQVVSGGRSAVSEPAWSGLAHDEAALARAQLTSAAQALRALRAASALAAPAEVRRARLARAWLVAWTYLGTASARLQRLSWTDAA